MIVVVLVKKWRVPQWDALFFVSTKKSGGINMFEKLLEIKTYLEGKFYEREKEIEGLLVSILAR